MAKSYKTAVEAGYKCLYHYQPFNPDHVESILLERKIRCSNPAKLNDPWDCRPWYATVDPQDIDKFMVWTRQFADPPGTKETVMHFEGRLRSDPEYRKRIIEGLSSLTHQVISQGRIYCLTPDPYSTLMWSHYTDKHRGICLEFGTDNSLFAEAMEVIYRSNYPRWVPHNREEYAFEMFLTKSDDWEYEQEYRIIGTVDNGKDRLALIDGEYLRLPEGALQSIIVRCEADYDAVRKLVDEHSPQIPVKRIARAPDQFRLEIA